MSLRSSGQETWSAEVTVTPADSAPALSQVPARDSTTLARIVRDRLRLAVVRNELPSGMRLSQEQVATQLGVSRMPVRTAFSDLVTEGLLEHRPGGGVTVKPLSQQDLQDVYEVRQAVESQAVRHATTHPIKGGIEQIWNALEAHRNNVDTYSSAELLEMDRGFHMSIMEATGNSKFEKVIVPIWSVVERVMYNMLQLPGVAERAWKEHAEIVTAIESGDANLAESLLRQHLEMAAANLSEAISRSG